MSENGEQYVRGIEATDRLAWNLSDAAQIMGISYSSLRKEIRARKIVPTPTFKLITKEEALRYLREEVQLARRKKRICVPA